MFKFFQKKIKKDPICGMEANKNFISKHGEKFCSDNCLKEYEKKNNIADDGDKKDGHSENCCH